MQISDPIDEENKQIIREISIKIKEGLMNRHQIIRIKQWLKKLQQPIQNKVWKQNRNLYMKALKLMISSSILQEPFSSLPPEGPLKKLSVYDISASIRDKIGNSQTKFHQSRRNSINIIQSNRKQLQIANNQNYKQNKMIQSVNPNQFSFGNNQILNSIKFANDFEQKKSGEQHIGLQTTLRKKSEKKIRSESNKFGRHNRKISYDFDRVDTFRKNFDSKTVWGKNAFTQRDKVQSNIIKSIEAMGEDIDHSISAISSRTYKNQTNDSYFHDLYFAENQNLQEYQDAKQYKIHTTTNKQAEKPHQQQLKIELGLEILKQCLIFLGSNFDNLSKFSNYGQILEKIVKTGDKFKQNFREIEINMENKQHEAIQKKFLQYSHKIREKLVSTDIETQKFMNYLQTINN